MCIPAQVDINMYIQICVYTVYWACTERRVYYDPPHHRSAAISTTTIHPHPAQQQPNYYYRCPSITTFSHSYLIHPPGISNFRVLRRRLCCVL